MTGNIQQNEWYDPMNKNRIFCMTVPKPPYDIEDLWLERDTGNVYMCIASREYGEFDKNDWKLVMKGESQMDGD